MCGLGRIPDNSLLVVCGDEVVVVAVDDVVDTYGVVVAVGAMATVFVWVQRC